MRCLFAVLVCLAILPSSLFGQGAALSGRVVDPAAQGVGVQNAAVLLEGYASRLSDQDGRFSFRGVPVGAYTLRVEAPGYEELRLRISLVRDTVLAIALRLDPIELDGVGVVLRKIELNGQVRDTSTNSWVSRAEVLSDQGHSERTNLFGKFDLDHVFDGPPLRMFINAFRYLPLDTTFIPSKERHTFNLVADPVMARIIEKYTARLDDRAGKRIYKYGPALNREKLARMRPSTSLREVLEREFPPYIARSVGCLFIDESEYRFNRGDEDYRRMVYDTEFVNDVERIELLEFPGIGRLIMVRLYTRDFFLKHVGSSAKLAVPSMIATPLGYICS